LSLVSLPTILYSREVTDTCGKTGYVTLFEMIVIITPSVHPNSTGFPTKDNRAFVDPAHFKEKDVLQNAMHTVNMVFVLNKCQKDDWWLIQHSAHIQNGAIWVFPINT
jgi:hypothetical protein